MKADTALVIGNSRFDEAGTIRAADDLLDAAEALAGAGFTVIEGEDMATDEMRALLSGVLPVPLGERLVIALSGHFAHSVVFEEGGEQTWFLGREVDGPDMATVGGMGISLTTVFDIARHAQGRAVVLLGTEDREIELGEGLRPGLADLDVPQGVTVVVGGARDVARFARRDLVEPGVAIEEMLALSDTLSGFGFLPAGLPFLDLPISEGAAAEIAPPQPVLPPADPQEQALWAAVQELDTVGAYAAYLGRYPDGPNAAEARARRDAIQSDPIEQTRRAEEALSLTRDQRREIQRDLSLLDFNPRGIDGLFGPGSRGAITAWQEANGYTGTGFVTGEQLAALSDMADRRAAELEEEARLRAEQQEREDRAFWQATGQGSDEAGLRAYLGRYPDGVFSDLATERLAAIEAAAQEAAAAEDRAAWQAAEGVNTVAGYRDYLQRFPEGAFAGVAAARIEELEGADRDAQIIAQLEAREAALGLAPVTRQLIEQRLAGLDLNPGRVDGTFDDDTRRALRRYQQARNLQVTGYLDQATVVRLMADAVGTILR